MLHLFEDVTTHEVRQSLCEELLTHANKVKRLNGA